jgi:hypothetical protein
MRSRATSWIDQAFKRRMSFRLSFPFPDEETREQLWLAPGRGSCSAQLQSPHHPVVGGLLQRKARDENGVADGADVAIASAASSSGTSLPGPVMRKFESSLGADLSSVRVHTGSESESAAHAVSARAYTMGQDIHFGTGQYDPSSMVETKRRALRRRGRRPRAAQPLRSRRARRGREIGSGETASARRIAFASYRETGLAS